MKGGKEDDRITGPLFPRLHVNDKDKGGPRAPPRNKMALYEQFSIPSQRFNVTASASTLPPHSARTLVPSASSSQGCGHGSIFSQFYVPSHTPAHLAEGFHSRFSDGMNLNSTRMECESRSIKHVNNRTLNATGSVAECSLLRPHDSSSSKNSKCKKFDDGADYRVPMFVQSGIAVSSSKDMAVVERERLTHFCANSPQKSCSATSHSSILFPNSNEKSLEETNISDVKSGKLEWNHSEDKPKEALVIKEPREKSVSPPESGEKFAETSNFAKASSIQDHITTSNACENSRYGNTRLGQESCGNDALGGPGCLNDIDAVGNGDALRVRKESCPKASLGNNPNIRNVSDKGNQPSDNKSGSFELGDAERTDEVSEASMVDFVPGMEISPDDLVGVIGPKHFWKARRAIVNW